MRLLLAEDEAAMSEAVVDMTGRRHLIIFMRESMTALFWIS